MWLKVSDDLPLQRRHRRLSDGANWTLVCLAAYSNREATGGNVDREDLGLVRPGVDLGEVRRHLAELVEAGAVEVTEDGWRAVWICEDQPDPDEIAAATERKKAFARERQRKKREKDRKRDAERDGERDVTRDAERDLSRRHAVPEPEPEPDPVPDPDPDLSPDGERGDAGAPLTLSAPDPKASKVKKPRKAPRSRWSAILSDPRVQEVADHFRTLANPTDAWSLEAPSRKPRCKVIHDCLGRGYSVEDLKRALTAAFGDAWMVSKGKATIEYALRDDVLDGLLAARSGNGRGIAPPSTNLNPAEVNARAAAALGGVEA